jgi:SAM-dependent methyltransferase
MDAEDARRQPARDRARAALARDEPLAWFEELYVQGDVSLIPWAELTPNPNFLAWAAREGLDGRGRRALKIGAGLGDDAEALAELGFEVVAFDISPSAVQMARTRFAESVVSYCVGDVLAIPDEWIGAFDFVLEAYTLQVLPPELRSVAATGICATLAPGGTLLAISRGRDEREPRGTMPWPLTPGELRALFDQQLEPMSFEDYVDHESPPVRRLRAAFHRVA